MTCNKTQDVIDNAKTQADIERYCGSYGEEKVSTAAAALFLNYYGRESKTESKNKKFTTYKENIAKVFGIESRRQAEKHIKYIDENKTLPMNSKIRIPFKVLVLNIINYCGVSANAFENVWLKDIPSFFFDLPENLMNCVKDVSESPKLVTAMKKIACNTKDYISNQGEFNLLRDGLYQLYGALEETLDHSHSDENKHTIIVTTNRFLEWLLPLALRRELWESQIDVTVSETLTNELAVRRKVGLAIIKSVVARKRPEIKFHTQRSPRDFVSISEIAMDVSYPGDGPDTDQKLYGLFQSLFSHVLGPDYELPDCLHDISGQQYEDLESEIKESIKPAQYSASFEPIDKTVFAGEQGKAVYASLKQEIPSYDHYMIDVEKNADTALTVSEPDLVNILYKFKNKLELSESL